MGGRMRDAINNNPAVKIGLIAVLLIVTGFFVMSSMGRGGGEEGGEEASSSVEVVTAGEAPLEPTVAGAPAATASVADTPKLPLRPLPHRVIAAFDANRTVVLMIVRKGGVDDALTTTAALAGAAGISGVSMFVVPVDQIARYSAITQGVEVSQVPAFIVLRPKELDQGIPSASISYGYLSPESVKQAIVDAQYRGRTLGYHP